VTSATRRGLAAAALLLLALPIALDLLITSDQEAIEQLLDSLEAACEARDADAVLACCEPDATLDAHPPWLPSSRTSLEAALRASFPRLEKLALERETLTITEEEPGRRRIALTGSAFAAIARLGQAPFRVEMTLLLAEHDGEPRFLVAAIVALEVKPLFG
jgi:hypothetical protein